MSEWKQITVSDSGRHLLLYDGVCGLCNAVVQFILPRDNAGAFVFAPVQSATGRVWLTRFGMNPDALDTFVVITNFRTGSPALLSRAHAALFVARALPQPWRSARLLAVLPWRALNFGYDVIARHRYRIFGRYDTCPIPSPETRRRFIDS
jgi:predicted DCC family thiol-disulfide oxidoreductase YuxK